MKRKYIEVHADLHKKIKVRAQKEGRKLFHLFEHLVEMGEEYEKILRRK